MAVIWAEGCDDFPTSSSDNEEAKVVWDDRAIVLHDDPGGGTGNGRFGGGYIEVGSVSGENFFTIDIDPDNSLTPTTLIVGFAIRRQDDSVASAHFPIRFLNSALTVIGEIRTKTITQQLELYDANGTLVATSSNSLVLNAWHFMEMKIVTGASGSLELRLDQGPSDTATEINETGVDFLPGAAGTDVIKYLKFATANNDTHLFYDDLYALDTTGSFNNDFIGDGRMIHLRPESDVSVQYTPSTGTDNFAVVDEREGADGDNNSSSTAANLDRFEFEDLPNPPDKVDFVYRSDRVAKTDAGGTKLKQHIKSGATISTSAAKNLLTTSRYYKEYWDSDPADSTAWTQAKVNALQGGYEVA